MRPWALPSHSHAGNSVNRLFSLRVTFHGKKKRIRLSDVPAKQKQRETERGSFCCSYRGHIRNFTSRMTRVIARPTNPQYNVTTTGGLLLNTARRLKRRVPQYRLLTSTPESSLSSAIDPIATISSPSSLTHIGMGVPQKRLRETAQSFAPSSLPRPNVLSTNNS